MAVRAGSLSDARVVALLRKHFLCVHVPDLVTKELMRDPRDRQLIQDYHDQLRAGGGKFGPFTPGLDAGEREVFLDSAGELCAIFLSLNVGQDKTRDQYSRAVRSQPDYAVEQFFARAAKALRATHGELPADFAALCAGTAPEVAAARALVAPAPAAVRGKVTLRVSLRSDLLMYEALTAERVVAWEPAQARQILPAGLTVGARQDWPEALARELAAAFHPPGAGVLVALRDESITCALTSEVEAVVGAVVRGRLRGRFELRADSAAERGVRPTYRPFRSCAGRLLGDWEFDSGRGALVSLRLVSEDGSSVFHHGAERQHDHRVGVELIAR